MNVPRKVVLFSTRLVLTFLLLFMPVVVWLSAISSIYFVLYSLPLTGEQKILIESLQVFSSKMDKEKIVGYENGKTFEIVATAEVGGPERFFYIKTNHKTSEINEPYFHTTAQRLFRKYGTKIHQASRWERTTKCAQFTLLGVVLFWGFFTLFSTLGLLSYSPLLRLVINLFKPASSY